MSLEFKMHSKYYFKTPIEFKNLHLGNNKNSKKKQKINSLIMLIFENRFVD
jgi:hypothetical protein